MVKPVISTIKQTRLVFQKYLDDKTAAASLRTNAEAALNAQTPVAATALANINAAKTAIDTDNAIVIA